MLTKAGDDDEVVVVEVIIADDATDIEGSTTCCTCDDRSTPIIHAAAPLEWTSSHRSPAIIRNGPKDVREEDPIL